MSCTQPQSWEPRSRELHIARQVSTRLVPGREVLLVRLELVALQVVVAQDQAERAAEAAEERQRRLEARPAPGSRMPCSAV